MLDVSVVIPVYNSEKTLPSVTTALIKELTKKWAIEIILVNDASQDNSDFICRELNKKYVDIVRYVPLKKNVGEYNAVRIGLEKALGTYVVTMDDDGQHPPEAVPKLIDAIESGDHDVVYAAYDRHREPWVRRVASWAHHEMAGWLWGKPRGLYLASFKIMKRAMARKIVESDFKAPYFEPIILKTTRRIGRVRVEHQARTTGQSGYTLRKLLSLSLRAYGPAFFERMKFIAAIIVMHALALTIRVPLFSQTNSDIQQFFWPWYDTFAYRGGWQALAFPFTDYAPFYTYLLLGMTYLKSFIPTLTAIKLIPTVFNFFAAYLMYRLAGLKYDSSKIKWGAYFAVLFAPTMALNGACWGQVDIVYGSFLLGAVLMLAENRPNAAMVYFSIAFAVKLQTIFLAPFLAALVLKKIIRWRLLLWIPATYAISALPCALIGRSWSSLMTVYLGQMTQYPRLSTNAPNVYSFIGQRTDAAAFYFSMTLAATIAAVFVFSFQKRKRIDNEFLLLAATLSAAFMPSVLPRMHGRYFFLADLLSIGLGFYQPRLLLVPFLFQFTSTLAYARHLWHYLVIPMGWLGVINLIPISILGVRYYRSLRKKFD